VGARASAAEVIGHDLRGDPRPSPCHAAASRACHLSSPQAPFKLDDDQLEALTDELLYAHPQVGDDAGRGLRWTGTPVAAPPPAVAPTLAQDREPLSYTPPHLAEQILTSRTALEGERKQVTVLFADLKGSMECKRPRGGGAKYLPGSDKVAYNTGS
jgi:hypothetical protein